MSYRSHGPAQFLHAFPASVAHRFIALMRRFGRRLASQLSVRQAGNPFAANKTGAEYRGGVCYFSFDAAAIFWADAAGRVGCQADVS